MWGVRASRRSGQSGHPCTRPCTCAAVCSPPGTAAVSRSVRVSGKDPRVHTGASVPNPVRQGSFQPFPFCAYKFLLGRREAWLPTPSALLAVGSVRVFSPSARSPRRFVWLLCVRLSPSPRDPQKALQGRLRWRCHPSCLGPGRHFLRARRGAEGRWEGKSRS